MKALNEGIFQQFFTKQEEKLEFAVAEIFAELFQEAFEQNGGRINKETFEDIIDDKLQDDQNYRDLLEEEFAKIQLDADGKANQQQIE